jgi:prolyl oligopeptidase
MKRALWFTCLGLAVLTATGALGAASVDDTYLWLEDVHGAKPLAWVAEQNSRTKAELQADPRYQHDYDIILATLDASDRIPYASFRHGAAYNFWQDAAHPKGIWRRTTIADYQNPDPKWETLLDIDKLAADEKENWVFEGADCASSEKRCLISLSRGGGDAHVVREFDLTNKTFVADGFTLPEAKSDATIVDDDTVLFATDFGPGSLTESGYPRIVKLWKRGQKIADAKTLFEGKQTDIGASPTVFRSDKGNVALIVNSPSFFETEYYYVDKDGSIAKLKLPLFADIKGLVMAPLDQPAEMQELVFTLREDWEYPYPGTPTLKKGSLIATPLYPLYGAVAGLHPPPRVLYAPNSRESIEDVSIVDGAIYASIFSNVTGSIHVFRPAEHVTWTDTKLDLPANGSTGIAAANSFGPEAAFTFNSYLTPPTLYFDNGDDKLKPIKSLPARFDASGMVTEQFEATSSDGVKIPYFVTRPKNLSGPTPTILYGYGGFEVSQTPSYSSNFGKLWLAQGGVYVVANIRGGGEFGPAWHQAALLENRQKAFDDFAAVAADLEKRGLTTPKQLGIMGGSNGGLLVSTVMTQHPELLGAVVCQVPLIDMIRYTQIGAGASWAAEYGDPADPKARAWIEKYSPYQNVSADKKYAPVLFVTATSDDRVTPVHARKMAAKMEAQGHDVLFYENTDGGHSAAANHKQAAEMWALSFVYLKRKLGLN